MTAPPLRSSLSRTPARRCDVFGLTGANGLYCTATVTRFEVTIPARLICNVTTPAATCGTVTLS